MAADRPHSRRRFIRATGIAATTLLAGCRRGPDRGTHPRATDGDGQPTATEPGTGGGGSGDNASALQRALSATVRPIDVESGASELDAVADDLASTPVVGVGETSHGVREFKRLPVQLVQRLVGEHGYRLVAMEGTLGDFAPVNDYVTGQADDLDAAMAALDGYFWRTEGIRSLFAWVREFNEGRSPEERAVVAGYDAQFYWTNARAVRDYLHAVDPEYLATVEADLAPLTEPSQADDGSHVLSADHERLIGSLRRRLDSRRADYVAASTDARWRLARRHLWTLERGLRATKRFHHGRTRAGESLRDEAMAANVAWLRDWTGADRTVVLGNANHTLRGYRAPNQHNGRMGQHLADAIGADYYSLAMLFGHGSFAAPTNHARTEFDTYEVGEPTGESLAATLASVDHPQCFLDFETARNRESVERWLESRDSLRFTVPSAPSRGALALPAAPGQVADGTCFVSEVSPARFLAEH